VRLDDDLARTVDEIVGPRATEVDRSASFPRKAVDALAVPAEFGGGGGSLRDATAVIRTLSAACGSTAMVVIRALTGLPLLDGPVA
jgi:isovaleryl-CoA dehydrogenase